MAIFFSPDPSHDDIKDFMDDGEREYWNAQKATPEERVRSWKSLEDLWRSIPDPTESQLEQVMGPTDWGHCQRGENREGILSFYRRKWKKERRAEAPRNTPKPDAPNPPPPEPDPQPPKPAGIRVPGGRRSQTAQEKYVDELRRFMPQPLRAEYEKAEGIRRDMLWDANERAFIEAEKREQQNLLAEQKRTEEILDTLQRVREDPSRAHLLPPDDASMADLGKWYDEVSKVHRPIPFPGEGGYGREPRVPDAVPPEETLGKRIGDALRENLAQAERLFHESNDRIRAQEPDSELGLNFVRNSQTGQVGPRAAPAPPVDPKPAPPLPNPDFPLRRHSLTQELQDEVSSAFPVESQSAPFSESSPHLFSWGIILVMISLLLATGIGVLALRDSDDFIVAKVCFCLVWLILGVKIVYSAAKAKRRSAFMTFFLVFLGCGAMGAAALASVNYVNRKRDAVLAKSRSESLGNTNQAKRSGVSDEMISKLAEHMNEGSQILDELMERRTPEPSQTKATQWAERVEKYLNDNGMRVYALRFKNTMTITYPSGGASSRTRPLVNWLYTRIKRLEEFIGEMQRQG